MDVMPRSLFFELWGSICPILSILAYGSIINNALTFKVYQYLEFKMEQVDYSLAIYPLYGSVFFSQILMTSFLYPHKQSGIPPFMFATYLISAPMPWLMFAIYSYWEHKYVRYIRTSARSCYYGCCLFSRGENDLSVELLSSVPS